MKKYFKTLAAHFCYVMAGLIVLFVCVTQTYIIYEVQGQNVQNNYLRQDYYNLKNDYDSLIKYNIHHYETKKSIKP